MPPAWGGWWGSKSAWEARTGRHPRRRRVEARRPRRGDVAQRWSEYAFIARYYPAACLSEVKSGCWCAQEAYAYAAVARRQRPCRGARENAAARAFQRCGKAGKGFHACLVAPAEGTSAAQREYCSAWSTGNEGWLSCRAAYAYGNAAQGCRQKSGRLCREASVAFERGMLFHRPRRKPYQPLQSRACRLSSAFSFSCRSWRSEAHARNERGRARG